MGIIGGFVKYKAIKRGIELLVSMFRRRNSTAGTRVYKRRAVR